MLHDEETPIPQNEVGYISSQPEVDYTLLPWDALKEVARVFTENCNEYGGKYERGNWELCYDYRQQLNPLISHTQKLITCEYDDEEFQHMTHIAARVLMMISIYIRHEIPNQQDK